MTTVRKDFNEVVAQQAITAFAGEAEQLVAAFLSSVADAASDPEVSFEDRIATNIEQFHAALVERVERLPAADSAATATTTKKGRQTTQDDAARAVDRLAARLMTSAGIEWSKAYPQAVDIVASRQPRRQPVRKSAATQHIEKAAQEMVQRGGLDMPDATARIFETRPDLVAAWRQEQMS